MSETRRFVLGARRVDPDSLNAIVYDDQTISGTSPGAILNDALTRFDIPLSDLTCIGAKAGSLEITLIPEPDPGEETPPC